MFPCGYPRKTDANMVAGDCDVSYFFENYVFGEILVNFRCADMDFPAML